MIKDPIIEEIHRIRLEIEAECQYDEQLFYEYICKLQEDCRDRLINLPPKPAIIPSKTIKLGNYSPHTTD